MFTINKSKTGLASLSLTLNIKETEVPGTYKVFLGDIPLLQGQSVARGVADAVLDLLRTHEDTRQQTSYEEYARLRAALAGGTNEDKS